MFDTLAKKLLNDFAIGTDAPPDFADTLAKDTNLNKTLQRKV